MKKKFLFGLAAVCGAALAAVYGPFYVSALGVQYMDTTLGSDRDAEYDAAQKIAQIYLAPILNSPAKIKTAIQKDYIRVVYAGGSAIADFKIRRWPSSIPVEFTETVPSVDTQRRSATWATDRPMSCTMSAGAAVTTYQTGYWGSDASLDSNGNWNVVGGWISTGPFTIRRFAQMCP